ncbi:MAG: tetratricopeptide repeat protein, partial [Candidatus Krumholzibacteriia bacterium]
VAAATTALVVLGQDRPEFTTGSRQAYALYQQGEERLNAFQTAAAESLLREAVTLDGNFAMARAALGEVLVSRGQNPAAKRQIILADSLARLLPREDERLLVQLRLPDLSGKNHVARDSLLAVAGRRLPRHPLLLRAKALRFRDQGDTDREEAAWREVLRADPNYARAYNWLGYLAAGQGRYLEALSYLRRYAFLAPDLANPHDSLGEIYTYMGELDAAEQEFRQALQLQPDFYPSLLGLARVYLAQGRLHRALDVLDQTRAQFAGTGVATAIDAFTAGQLFDQGYPQLALAPLARLSVAEPKSEEAAWMRSLVLAHEGHVAAARALGDSLLAIWRASPRYATLDLTRRRVECRDQVLRALISGVQREPTREVAAWGKALIEAHRFPPHERWSLQWRYAESLERLAQPAAALEQTREILAVNPRLIGPLLLQARCALELGRADEARTAFVPLDAALARADADLPAVATADSLRRLLPARPIS